jgi:cell division transport system permease protein
MFSRRSDLPLDTDVLGRFLPWIIAFMVFMAIFAAAGMFAIENATGQWRQGLTHTLTVQIRPSPESGTDSSNRPTAAKDDPRVSEALRILHATDGVIRADLVSETQMASMLEPWLGEGISADDLPLPFLIDVEADSAADIDTDSLRKRLVAADPDISVDDHRVWLDRLVRLANAIEMLATAVLLFVGGATAGTVVYTTRTGLEIHREAIEVLHLIGAHDSYVATQFAWRALNLGVRGGLAGLALAVPALFGIGYFAANLEAGLLPRVSFGFVEWAAIAAIPALTAILSMVTARITVLRTLAKML